MLYVKFNSLKVAEPLVDFIEEKVLPGLDLTVEEFWQSFESIIENNQAENQSLLNRRDELQQRIDEWHRQNEYDENDLVGYKKFLSSIGYLLEEGDDFNVSVEKVDKEIAQVAAPQLVVPINNARFSINAANARWGSLYDALYGTDMIEDKGDTAKTSTYNEKRGQQVFDFCQTWLDEVLPLQTGSHIGVVEYRLTDQDGSISIDVILQDQSTTTLQQPEQFCGYSEAGSLVLLFNHHDLYFELQINKKDGIGSLHKAGLKDIVVEAAVTTIQDCEDSVAAVDVEDKILVYSNWLEIIQGSLQTDMTKGGEVITRTLNPNRLYRDGLGNDFSLPGRSLMLIRNTGLHMQSEMVLSSQDELMPEGIIDALVSVLISMHDRQPNKEIRNSQQGSVYIVKPKLHGPQEVAFSCKVFSEIEQAYGLPENTVKIGVMDEERRTTINLKECIRQAKNRIIFINTGFLDRTGDEIHTSMQAGPMLPKGEIKNARWMGAYENWNVDTGLLCGLDGVAQIGKGMWAIPDQLKQMYVTKRAHPEAGASCAWVPSPTAATLHALHYHSVNVKKQQQEIKHRKRASVDDILSIPLMPESMKLTDDEIQQELDNNAQGILGYVVKWIELGIGCSTVPDINDTGLMEDRATLRISSQHMANWLVHGLCSEKQVVETFQRMAKIVDEQNTNTLGYIPMAPDFNGVAFNVALDLVLRGAEIANGYTEDLLHQYRRKVKVG